MVKNGVNRPRKPRSAPVLPLDPVASAKVAGLRYVDSSEPGISRKKSGRGVVYVGPSGKKVTDPETLNRIRALVIPPAWTNVWICAESCGHLQAVGLDAKGRKQYRYHPAYRAVRDATKFHRMRVFGEALPKIRAQATRDLSSPNLTKKKVLATIVKLLDETSIRVGNEEYVKDNDSYGLTTLRDQHVEFEGSKIRFRFRGKSGQMHDITLTDRRLAKVVKQCQDIPGFELFQYWTEDGEHARIDSSDVNDYLREITGADFTAKDFRTWAGTGCALQALQELGSAGNQTEAKKKLVAAIRQTAAKLGNRPATCRKYYVHPAVFDGFLDGSLFELASALEQCAKSPEDCGLRQDEHFVLVLIEQHALRALSNGKAKQSTQ